MATLSAIRHKCEQVIAAAARAEGKEAATTIRLNQYGRWHYDAQPKVVADLLTAIVRLPYRGKNRRQNKSRERKLKQIKAKAKELGLV